MYAALDAPTRTLIASFVSSGHTIQTHGGTTPNDVNFLNGIFGYTMATNGFAASPGTRTAAAASTPFATAPVSVNDNSAVTIVALAGLPAGSICIYDSGTDCMMFTVPNGAGRVVFMGWDWFGAPPQGAADGGWLAVANLVSTTSAPPTVRAPIPTLSEWGMIMLSSLLALGAVLTLRR